MKVKILQSLKALFAKVKTGLSQSDKRKHLIVGFTISFLVGIFLPWLGILLGFIAGAVKEWWDSKGHGTVDLWDFVFTGIGALCAFPVAWLIHFIIWSYVIR